MLCFAFVALLLATSQAAEDVKPETLRTERQSGWYASHPSSWPFYDAYPNQEDFYQLRSLPRRPVNYGYNPNALQFDDVDGRQGFGLFNNAFSSSRPAINFLNSLPIIRNPNFPTLQNILNSFDSCTATTGESGICTPGFACSAYGGRPSGSCGLGTVCCINVVSTCSSQITLNNTYWETPSTSLTRPTSCSLTVKLDQRLLEQRKSAICQVRLDFTSFAIEQPGTDSVCSTDVFRVDGASNTVPEICGENPGQHMYITVPNSGTTATNLNLVFSFGRTGTVVPSWKIKVSLLPCGANYLAPDNCLQYFTSASGTVSSFNWKDLAGNTRQLADQIYRVCFRSELINGNTAKTMRLSACTATATGFSVSGDTGTLESQAYDPPCSTDYVIFAGGYKSDKSSVLDRFCGTAFSTDGASAASDVYSDIAPFSLVYVTDGDEGNDLTNIGFCFNYQQTA